MPWLIAAFIVMVYVVPFDSINFPLGLPVDTQFDRVFLVVVFLIWLLTAFTPRSVPISPRRSPVNLAIFIFLTLCFLSICFNLRDLTWDGELSLSIKQLLLSLSYIAVFFVAATSLQREEIEPLVKLLVVLAALSAIGTIYEYRSSSDIFYTVAQHLFRPIHAVVKSAPHPKAGVRGAVVGPTGESLADATLLSMAVPFALALTVHARTGRATILWALAMVLLIAGCVSTGRKSGLVVPVAAILAMIVYEPRRYLRFWPLFLIAVAAIIIAAPHAISSLVYQFRVAGSSSSTDERTADYAQVAPYIASHLLLGRGFGSFDPHKYIILDDTMLGLVVQIGVLGTVAYAGLIGTTAYVAHRAARAASGYARGLMAACVGACAGFFVSNFLYDASSFRQGPYVFFTVAAFVVVYAKVSARGDLAARGAPPPEASSTPESDAAGV